MDQRAVDTVLVVIRASGLGSGLAEDPAEQRAALPIRSIHSTTFDAATWPTAKTALARALATRSRPARKGWWN
jgi:hypothetical protein